MAESMEDLKKLKVPELKQALKDRGLTTSGTKPDLIKRLAEAMGTADAAADDSLNASDDDILNDDLEPVTAVALSKPAPPVVQTPAAAAAAAAVADKPSASNGIVPSKPEQVSSSASSAGAVKVTAPSQLSEAERLKLRAEKFGITSEEAKKELRAQRFGMAASGDSATPGKIAATSPVAADMDKLKKRAERFGVVAPALSKVDEEERKRKRAERFGVTTTTGSAPAKASVSLNVVDSDLEAKKRKRAERFGLKT